MSTRVMFAEGAGSATADSIAKAKNRLHSQSFVHRQLYHETIEACERNADKHEHDGSIGSIYDDIARSFCPAPWTSRRGKLSAAACFRVTPAPLLSLTAIGLAASKRQTTLPMAN
jgi:hypothetical protein